MNAHIVKGNSPNISITVLPFYCKNYVGKITVILLLERIGLKLRTNSYIL